MMNIMGNMNYVAVKSNIILRVHRDSLSTLRGKSIRTFLISDQIFNLTVAFFGKSKIITILRSEEININNHDLRCFSKDKTISTEAMEIFKVEKQDYFLISYDGFHK